MSNPGSQFTRAIRLPQATALVVGTIIGASIFVQPAEVTGRVPSLPGALLVWLVAGVLTFFGSLVTAEWAAVKPESGGVYAFLRDAFSPALGFLWGWAMFWTMHSGIIAAIAVVFARYLAWFVPLDETGVRVVGVAAILALSWVNFLGVRQASTLQTTLTVVKVGAVVLMIAIGLALVPSGQPAAAAGVDATAGIAFARGAPEGGLLGGGSFRDFLLALVAGLFAFGGWHMVTYSAEETVDPRKTIPRSLVLGIAIVTATYLALNYVYFRILPIETVIASERIAADAADAVLGRGGGSVMSGLVALSTFGALAGIVLAGPRVYHAMARDGLLFRWVADLHRIRRTPHRAILLQAGWASVLVWTESYRALFTRVVYTEWIFFGLMALGLIFFRRASDAPEPLVARWAYPWVPIVFAICAFGIVANQVAAQPVDSIIGLGLVLIGLPVYALVVKRWADQPGSSS